MKCKYFFLFLLLWPFQIGIAQQNVICLKINQIKGDNYKTKIKDEKKLAAIFKKELEATGYTVLLSPDTQVLSDSDNVRLLFLDVFIYQFDGVKLRFTPVGINASSLTMLIGAEEEPLKISLHLRDDEKVFYEKEYYVELLTLAGQKSIEKRVKKIAYDIPGFETILERRNSLPLNHFRMNRMRVDGKKINEASLYPDNIYAKFEFKTEHSLSFLYDESAEMFMRHLISENAIYETAYNQRLEFDVEINEFGYTLLKAVRAPVELSTTQQNWLKMMIAGIPLWKNPKRERVKATLKMVYYSKGTNPDFMKEPGW